MVRTLEHRQTTGAARCWCVAVVFLLCPGLLPGQVTLGLQGGVVRSSLSGDNPIDTKYRSRIGPALGGFVDVFFTRDVALRIEAGYTQRGTHIAFKDRAADEYRDSIDVRLDYLALPIMAKVFAGHSRTFVTGGVDVGVLMSASVDDGSGARDADALFTDYNVSVLLGFGVALSKHRPEVTVELRYFQSLTNLGDNPGSSPLGANLPQRFRLRGLQLLGSIGWTLGRRSE